MQTERFSRTTIATDAQMGSRQVKRYCILKPDAQALLAQAMDELHLSARAYTKVLKVSRTLADLVAAPDAFPQ